MNTPGLQCRLIYYNGQLVEIGLISGSQLEDKRFCRSLKQHLIENRASVKVLTGKISFILTRDSYNETTGQELVLASGETLPRGTVESVSFLLTTEEEAKLKTFFDQSLEGNINAEYFNEDRDLDVMDPSLVFYIGRQRVKKNRTKYTSLPLAE